MYEISKEYLSRLLDQRGVKTNSAKSHAMVAIIECLDENSLNGLLASIKEDYAKMLEETKNLNTITQRRREILEQIQSFTQKVGELRRQETELKARIQNLKEEEAAARFEADLRGCRDEERSRLIAYEAAIRIGKAAYDIHIPDGAMPQILRSASNVAAGFVSKELKGNTHEPVL